MSKFQHVDVGDLELVKRSLTAYVQEVDERLNEMPKVNQDLGQLAEIVRMLIERVQYLEAEVKELRP